MPQTNPITSRATLINYCKRRLGDPVVELNIDDTQIQDRIDDALQYYQDYHYDGIERVYLKHQVTSTDITNKYISITDAIVGVINVFPVTDTAYSTVNMFDMRYQLHLSDLYDFSDVSMLHYSMVMQHLSLLDDYLVGKAQFDYATHTDKLHLYIDWANDITVDEYIVIECYRILDPETYAQVYDDMWLKRYATALIKRQWGQNLSKFDGITLPGGLTYNGQAILESANEEITTLEEQMESSFGGQLGIMVG